MARILLIDDDKQIILGLRSLLEHEGHEVFDAQDGKKGMEVFKNNPVDLVVTDIIMPEQEGLETIKELRNADPQVKILVISGGGAVDPRLYLHIAEHIGAGRTLAKPFAREEFLGMVRELLV